ncbi:MAG TPA: TetR/AcrR family transcriptional regulator [Ilumatobacteraceae bacterium]|nr:TetR/AcrR family transcriptional regulator [Ilumatobacteraceae bacterium]
MADDLSTPQSGGPPQVTPNPAREALLAAALDIIDREGSSALTVRSVAKAAGCSTTGVYTWFGGKNGLVEQIFVDSFRQFGAHLLAAKGVRSTTGDRALRALGHAYREWALANPTRYMVMFGKAVPDYEPSMEARTVGLTSFAQLTDVTAAHLRRVGSTLDPLDIAFHLWAGVHGYVSLEMAGVDLAANDRERAARFEVGIHRLLRGCLP